MHYFDCGIWQCRQSHTRIWRPGEQCGARPRKSIAALAGVDATEVLFTSGATEANNLAILGLADSVVALDGGI